MQRLSIMSVLTIDNYKMVHKKQHDCLLELFSLLCDQRAPVKQKKIKKGKSSIFKYYTLRKLSDFTIWHDHIYSYSSFKFYFRIYSSMPSIFEICTNVVPCYRLSMLRDVGIDLTARQNRQRGSILFEHRCDSVVRHNIWIFEAQVN